MKPRKTDEGRGGWAEERLTNLRLGDHGVVTVTQRAELQALLALHVALLEELLHAPGGPLVVQGPGLGWVSHVTGVEQQAQHSSLVQAGAVMTAGQDCLHLLQLREMHRHIWKCEES